MNGDGAVDGDELQRAAEQRGSRHALVTWAPTVDTDDDGVLSANEIIAHADRQAAETVESIRNSDAYDVGNLLLFDQNGDGAVRPGDLVAIAESLAAAAGPASTACNVPSPPAGAEVVVLQGSTGGALSSVALLGRDTVTTVATLDIEPGERPLYILATASENVIWKLDRATERVTHFVAQPGRAKVGPGSGVVGLPAARVSFPPNGACLRGFPSTPPAAAQIARAFLAARLGRDVDQVIYHSKLHAIRLPSGAQDEAAARHRLTVVRDGQEYEVTVAGLRPVAKGSGGPPPGFDQVADPTVARALLSFYPGGVIRIDAAKVVAPAPVEAYDVLPQQAGLLQLLEDGALERTPEGEFRILQPIPRFPALLGGAHSVRFILAPGVPMPGGDPVHSTVVLQETGECVAGPCRN